MAQCWGLASNESILTPPTPLSEGTWKGLVAICPACRSLRRQRMEQCPRMYRRKLACGAGGSHGTVPSICGRRKEKSAAYPAGCRASHRGFLQAAECMEVSPSGQCVWQMVGAPGHKLSWLPKVGKENTFAFASSFTPREGNQQAGRESRARPPGSCWL